MRHGGVEMAISLLSNALAKRGYQVTILSIYNLGEVAYPLEPSVEVRYLTSVAPNKEEFLKAKQEQNIINMIKEGFYSVKVLYLKRKKMIEALKKIQDGIVISTRNEHSVMLSKYGGKKVYKIAQLHHDHEFKKEYIKSFQKKYGNIDKFVLLTEEIQQEVEEMMKGYNSYTECITIPNFLNLTCDVVQFDEKKKTVVAAGRLHPVKGFDRLIDIWEIVSRTHSDWKLKIIGGGEQRENLENKIREKGLLGKIEITGMLSHSDVLREMRSASVYALTSYSEAFGFVLIEAMSSGLPVIAFDVRVGPRTIIRHDVDGFLVEDQNIEKFANYINYLIDDSSKRIAMSQNAINRAKTYTETQVMRQWIALFCDDKYEKESL